MKTKIIKLYWVLLFFLPSCEQIAKKVTKEVAEKSTESISTRTIKNISQETSSEILLEKGSKEFLQISFSKLSQMGASKDLTSRILKMNLTHQQKYVDELILNPSLLRKSNLQPDISIKKWLNTRNHVNKKLIQRVNDRYPINSTVYSGNTYYFDPDYNKGLAAKIKVGIVDPKEASRLNELYPNGIKFSTQGFPDFEPVAFKYNGKTMKVDLKQIYRGTTDDYDLAEKQFKLQNPGYSGIDGTWHHIENTTILIKLPREVHNFIKHTGGAAIVRYNQ